MTYIYYLNLILTEYKAEYKEIEFRAIY